MGRTTLSLATLGHRLRSVPMLLVLIPFALGIVLYEYYALPLTVVLATLAITSICAWLLLPHRVAWGYIALALVIFGYAIAELRAPRPSLPYDTPSEIHIRIESQPIERNGYRRAEGRIVSWRDNSKEHTADDRVVLWLRSDSIGYGDEVAIEGVLVKRMSRNANYNRLLHRRGMVGGVGISDYNIIDYHPTTLSPTLQQRATERLSRFAKDTSSYAVVEAMVAGSRRLMPTPLRDAYSATGLSHLMAVSGLHLGIVAMVIATLLLPLSLIHRGHRIANLLTIVAIWFFAAMSGMSPSVVRAALMLSLLQLSLFASSRYSSLNALAVAAFAMLIYRPDYLYDISFELSVLAVMGIILWAVPMMRYTARLAWLPRTIINTFGIGIAATLWTLPLVSQTFGNLPIATIILTPAVMLFSYLVVAFGIFTLMLPTPIASLTAAVAEWAAGVQNIIVEYAATLPISNIDYTFAEWQTTLCYTIYIVITLLLWSINRKKVITLSYDDV